MIPMYRLAPPSHANPDKRMIVTRDDPRGMDFRGACHTVKGKHFLYFLPPGQILKPYWFIFLTLEHAERFLENVDIPMYCELAGIPVLSNSERTNDDSIIPVIIMENHDDAPSPRIIRYEPGRVLLAGRA